ncbi:MAG TPA: trimethylamine methyltransferase family protein [candidate division Zixibacteria bacterium]|nr:trimethylamine methyltransferase family protein [candidate division Zixibacteria bacterium]
MTTTNPMKHRVQVETISIEQLAKIKEATLHVLETVGIHFPSEQALKVFAEHGAQVNWESQIVRLSPELVLEAMSHAPRTYTLSGRADGTDLTLDGKNSYFATDGCGTETIDIETGERRSSSKSDVAMMARVADYLSSIAFYWPMVSAQDFGRVSPLHELDASFNNTVKHIQSATIIGEKIAHYSLLMAEVIAGGKAQMRAHPPLSSLVCTIAPLGQDKDGIEGAMLFAKAGMPVGFMAMPNIGSTSPATMASALTIGNAEVASAMTLMQLVAPGAPVFHSVLASVMDPRSGNYLASLPGKYLCNGAAVQMAHDWGVPTLAGAFGVDCREPASYQLGRDSVYTALLSPMSGADLVEGLGLLRASTLLLPEQIIYDDEMVNTNRILLEGIDTSADQLALDVIEAVGPGGHFMAQKHTRRTIRDIWIPELTHPAPLMSAQAGPDIRERARETFKRILTEHQPTPLSRDIQLELQNIMKAAAESFI